MLGGHRVLLGSLSSRQFSFINHERRDLGPAAFFSYRTNMAYKITSLERIDASSLPSPLDAGKARWKATVEFWPDEAAGPAPLIDDVILEIPTQGMRPSTGDDWELIPKHEYLANFFNEFLEQLMPAYRQRIADGMRGNMAEHDEPEQHGRIKADDAIAKHPDVLQLVGIKKAARTDPSEVAKRTVKAVKDKA